MNRNRKFSYAKLALSAILTLSSSQVFASMSDESADNQLGIKIGAYTKAKMAVTETKMENNPVLAFFPEQTVGSDGKAADRSGDGIGKSQITVSTNTSEANANKFTIDNGYEVGGFLEYALLSPSSEGGMAISARINGGASIARKYKLEFADGAAVTLPGAELNSATKDLLFKDNVEYSTSNKGNNYTIERNTGFVGGIGINAGYAINDSIAIEGDFGGGITMAKYGLSGTSNLTSKDDKTAFKHTIQSTISGGTSETVTSYYGFIGANLRFNLTPSFSVAVSGGIDFETEQKIKFTGVKIDSTKSSFALQVAPTPAKTATNQDPSTTADARYYGAKDTQNTYQPLKLNEEVVNTGTSIAAKTIEIERTIPSVLNAYIGIRAILTF